MAWCVDCKMEVTDGYLREHRTRWHDRRVVACNLTESTNIGPAGARCYVIRPNPGGSEDRIVVLVRSHGGRWVEKWESIKRLSDFRVKTLPPEHPLHGDERLWDYDVDIYVERFNAAHGKLTSPTT